jgi:hypothetical protein
MSLDKVVITDGMFTSCHLVIVPCRLLLLLLHPTRHLTINEAFAYHTRHLRTSAFQRRRRGICLPYEAFAYICLPATTRHLHTIPFADICLPTRQHSTNYSTTTCTCCCLRRRRRRRPQKAAQQRVCCCSSSDYHSSTLYMRARALPAIPLPLFSCSGRN